MDAFLWRWGVRALALGLALLAPPFGPRPAEAELIVGLTTDNRLTTFDSATPGSATSPVSITGIAAGETVLGIDRRPSFGPNNGQLYALGIQGTVGRLYTITSTTGIATLASTLNVALDLPSTQGATGSTSIPPSTGSAW